jgi:molybdopterin synthase catalytic subunit
MATHTFMHQTNTTWVQVTPEVLDTTAADAFLRTEQAGGLVLFVGTTRRFTHGRETVKLSYDAYVPMAGQEMRRLAEEAAQRWPVHRTCLLHRVGEVPVAEASVVIGVACAHRAAAFAACRWLIDTLKERVPIWKQETYADGSTEWVGGQG